MKDGDMNAEEKSTSEYLARMQLPGVLYRPIEVKDNEKLAKIIRNTLEEFKANKPGTVYYDATTDDLFTLFMKERAAYFVAESNGVVVGGAGVYPTEGLETGCCELVKLYLKTESRGKGIGKALIMQCIEAAKAMGYKKIYLETMPELSMAIGLYEKCGFRYLPAPMGNSGHFGCDIWMARQL